MITSSHQVTSIDIFLSLPRKKKSNVIGPSYSSTIERVCPLSKEGKLKATVDRINVKVIFKDLKLGP